MSVYSKEQVHDTKNCRRYVGDAGEGGRETVLRDCGRRVESGDRRAAAQLSRTEADIAHTSARYDYEIQRAILNFEIGTAQ
jgi:hypothetical protein